MEQDLGDRMDELIKNDEDDGLTVEVIEEEEKSGDEMEGNSLFIQSSLLSIKRGTLQNNYRKRPFNDVESSPSLKSGSSSKRWKGDNN